MRISGIDVSIHWTFVLFLGWILVAGLFGGGLAAALVQTGFVVAAFACVVLHEFGHAFAARMFGIPTHGITLLPIGGVAELDRIPRNPWQEFVIAVAGPAVNVLIARIDCHFLVCYVRLSIPVHWACPGRIPNQSINDQFSPGVV